jgi:hypothetical protein
MTVHRSTEGGATWEDIGEGILASGWLTSGWGLGGPLGPEPLHLAPDPAPGGALYAATTRGLFKWVPDSN